MNKKQNSKGITLVALIITVILMLILAGVSISIAINGGLFATTKEAAKQTAIQTYKEKIESIRLDLLVEQISKGLTGKEYIDRYEEELRKDNNLKGSTIERKDDNTLTVTTKEGYIFEITEEETKYIGDGEGSGDGSGDKPVTPVDPTNPDQPEEPKIEDLNKSNTTFTYEPEGWTNGKVKVKIEVKEEIKGTIEYSTDEIPWKEYGEEEKEKGIEVSSNGAAIYARVINSAGKEGTSATGNVENIDIDKPKINIELNSTGETYDAITLSINVEDTLSGISTIKWYYKLSTSNDDYTPIIDEYTTMNGTTEGKKEAETKTKELTGLEDGETYSIYAEVYDVAGNSRRSPETGTINVATKEMPKPQIGDYVNYEPDIVTDAYELLGEYSGYGTYVASNNPTLDAPIRQSISQEELIWQVLKMHSDGTIDLIGSPTEGRVHFNGPLGYNNGVYLLHDICKKLYSKQSAGITARSVSLEDFEDDNNGGSWKTERNSYTTRYGLIYLDKDTITRNLWYPSLYVQENGSGIDKNTVKSNGITATNKYYTSPTREEASKASSKLTVTQTYYEIDINETNYKKAANVLYSSSTYWVATRSVASMQTDGLFYLLQARTKLDGAIMLRSDGYTDWTWNQRLRPVVTLNSNVQLKLKTEGTGDSPNTFNITKY